MDQNVWRTRDIGKSGVVIRMVMNKDSLVGGKSVRLKSCEVAFSFLVLRVPI